MLIRHPNRSRDARQPNLPHAAPQATQELRATSVQRSAPARATDTLGTQNRKLIRGYLYDQIDPLKAAAMGRDKLRGQIESMIRRICDDNRLQLSRQEEEAIGEEMLNEMVGIGPIEPLLADDSVNDILVNGAGQVFVERFGKLELSPITFVDEEHVFNTAQRIAAAVGRRIDESHPMVDARLADGSRVNVITYPLAIDGTTISIRKFMRRNMSLEILAERGALSPDMVEVLRRAMVAKLNIIVSGGTGAGKTTLLNALSQKISFEDRIITIEDAAELQLQQIHVVRLETRPVSAEGTGKVDQRDLVRNALRMRPDRIILGEVRGGESFDMLQAMNTGHEGSLATIHSNTPRDALSRLENMVSMAAVNLTPRAIRQQIVSAVTVVVQVSRLTDGTRKLVSLQEITGMEGEIISMQEIFRFEQRGVDVDGKVLGHFSATGVRPRFADRLKLFGVPVSDDSFDPDRRFE